VKAVAGNVAGRMDVRLVKKVVLPFHQQVAALVQEKTWSRLTVT